MKSSTSGSVKFVCFRRTERLNIASGQTSIFKWDELNREIKNLYYDVYSSSFGRKFITGRLKLLFGVIQLIGSTRPKCEI